MPREDTYTTLMLLVGSAFLVLAFLLVVYYAVAVPTETSFGERYVNEEIPLIFPFYVISSFKPITLICYFVFLGAVLVLEASKSTLKRFDTRGTRIFLLLLTFAAGYEVLWNFFAWFAEWQKRGGPLDMLANTHHTYLELPANFNFVTKLSFLIFALSLYAALFLGWIERDKNRGSVS